MLHELTRRFKEEKNLNWKFIFGIVFCESNSVHNSVKCDYNNIKSQYKQGFPLPIFLVIGFQNANVRYDDGYILINL